ncbi:DUF6256 family protein [Streptomyces vilmorinianum]|uniref:DUF6256 family protein n=1 Tax=Streptomyces vilmorinianum TaxID=3051092 RepID=UPI0010FBA481|nr:DUF6256 family protein [Streptomyces vilmorinianum]
MLIGYLLVMGYLAIGLRILRRRPAGAARVPRRFVVGATRRGWPLLIRQVVGTAVGGYVLLMAVVVLYYQGVARLGGRFLASAFTGAATLVGITLPVFFLASWVVARRRKDGAATR